jgi:two-component sensor histidine kinase
LLEGDQPRLVKVAGAQHRDGTAMTCEWYLSALRGFDGKPVSLNALVLDVTERTRAEETQRLLIGELNHRVKNTLATVQAIATQTLRHNRNLDDFSASFAGRLQALARAHSLLSDAVWKGADLADLVSDQLRLGAIDERRLSVSGPRIFLPPQLALHLALILHELATNANKYGALSCEKGSIILTWAIADDRLEIRWMESGVDVVEAPTKRGFGTTLIEQSAKAEGGAAKSAYRSDGMTWNLSFGLPRAIREEFDLAARDSLTVAETAEENLTSATLAGKKLLVVEDEPLVAIEIEMILQDEGAEVQVVGSVAEALQSIEQSQFDAALLDGNLHGAPVDEIAAALVKAGIPFAFVSGYGKQNLPRGFASAPVVAKPFMPSELLSAALDLLPVRSEVVHLIKSASVVRGA